MFLFIFESIGTSELILIGIVALIFLGPRKLPEMARKIGKMMAEFRGTASEFKETWQREVDFEEEAKAFDLDTIEAEAVARVGPGPAPAATDAPAAPVIKEIDPATLEHLRPADNAEHDMEKEPAGESRADDKRNWL